MKTTKTLTLQLTADEAAALVRALDFAHSALVVGELDTDTDDEAAQLRATFERVRARLVPPTINTETVAAALAAAGVSYTTADVAAILARAAHTREYFAGSFDPADSAFGLFEAVSEQYTTRQTRAIVRAFRRG